MALNLLALGSALLLLPGASLLFSLPLLSARVGQWVADRTQRRAFALTGVVFSLSRFLPVLHIFTLLLTLGALGIACLLAGFPLALCAALAADGRS